MLPYSLLHFDNKTCACLQVCPVWRLHWHIHLLLLHLLLPRAVRHVRLHADILLLWLHDLRLLRLLPHARHCRFPRITLLRAAHLPLHQVRVNHKPRLRLDSLGPVVAVAGQLQNQMEKTVTGSIAPEFSAPVPSVNLWSSVFLLTFLSCSSMKGGCSVGRSDSLIPESVLY